MSKHTHHHQAFGVIKSDEIQTKGTEEENSLKLRAYQIHLEKGGSDLDNWLEAEKSLSNKTT